MSKNLKENIRETGNLVEEYMQGNVRIRIFDSAYINRSKEDIDRTLERITQIAKRVANKSVQ
ncbi:hypothetical protein FQB35_10665 [Crassaminicella thermophila]|uniref:Uncharacterized protein n=1 Tax=Crassaminicella thermophila TaxID=2599308 RepID=A0A5C0SH67_CRATE|nr:hypothetical protein [Crassaminicella thermophila]QEK12754.1 hypothetical protein FQB35_10665 [Crassaminicella thermophila]